MADAIRANAHLVRLRREKLAFGLVRGLSGLTIVVLGLIVGFIFVKGLWYSNQTRSSYLPFEEDAPDGLVVVVNRETALERVDFGTLYGIYTDEYINWSKIDAEDLDLLPLAVDPATPDGQAAERLLFGAGAGLGSGEPQWGGLVAYVPSAAQALAKVASTPGTVAIVPAQEATAAGVAILPLRRFVLAVHEGAAELVDNRSVRDIDAKEAEALLRGSFSNWKELGGPDLPVLPLDGSISAIASTPGAVGRVPRRRRAESRAADADHQIQGARLEPELALPRRGPQALRQGRRHLDDHRQHPRDAHPHRRLRRPPSGWPRRSTSSSTRSRVPS